MLKLLVGGYVAAEDRLAKVRRLAARCVYGLQCRLAACMVCRADLLLVWFAVQTVPAASDCAR